MDVSFTRIDLAECKRLGHPYQAVIERKAPEVWLVPSVAIELNKPVQWSIFQSESQILIPLFVYGLRKAPDLAMADMLSRGLRAAFSLNREVKQFHVVTGVPVQEVHDDEQFGLRFFVNFGVVLK